MASDTKPSILIIVGRREILLLPGLDGTGLLFAGLQRELGNEVRSHLVSYPADPLASLDDLAVLVEQGINEHTTVLVAESFSGPIALRVAARGRVKVERLVLVASFSTLTHPLANIVMLLSPFIASASLPVPRTLVAGMMLSGVDDPGLIDQVMHVVRAVPIRVAAARVRMLAAATTADAACAVPALAIHARRDRLISKRIRASLHRGCTNIEEIFVDGPHLLNQAHPRVCAGLIKDFI